MSVQDDISQASQPDGTDPNAPSVVQRLAAIHAQGGGFIDPSLQATLASSGQSTDGVSATVHAIGQTVASGIDTLTSSARTVFEDPVLYKKPTAALQLHQLLTQQMGWSPIEQVDLHKVQQQLQKSGYGKDLTVSGVWTSDWQSAFHQASQDHLDAQRSSNEGHGFNALHAVGGFLSSFNLSHAVPALVGAAKGLNSDVKQLAGTIAGSAVNTVMDPESWTFHESKAHQEASAGAKVARFFEGDKQVHQAIEHPYKSLINNINTLLVALPIVRSGSVVAHAGGQVIAKGAFKDLGAAAAQRGPGTISNMLYRPAGFYADGSHVEQGGVLAARALDHLPYLRQMMPGIRTSVEGGQRWWYYTARPFVAAPYRLPIVAAAGHAGSQVMFTGALLRGDANVMRHIEGRDSAFANGVLGQKPYTGPLGVALDLLGGVAHGPLITRGVPIAARSAEEAATLKPASVPAFGPNPSQQVGDIIRNGMRAYDAMLGKPGVIGAWERGTGLDYNQTLAEFEKAGLHEADLKWGIQSKVDQLAAGHGAHQELLDSAERGIPRERQFATTATQIRGDATRLGKYRGQLLDSDVALANRFAQDHNAIIQNPKAQLGSMIQEAKARKVAYQLVNDPTLAWQNVHGGTFKALQDAQAEHEFSKAAGTEQDGVPVPEGHTRLYRAVGGETRGSGNPELNGRWFTPFKDIARRYGDELLYVDVPTGDVNKTTGEVTGHMRYNVKRGQGPEFDAARSVSKDHAAEYLLPSDIANSAQHLPAARPLPVGPQPALTAGWLRANNPDASPASLGIARTDKLLRGDVLQKATEFEKQIARTHVAAGETNSDTILAQDPAAIARIRKQMGGLLLELGVDPNSVPGGTDEMLAMLKARANDLAEKVTQPLNPTPEYTAARKALNDLGYELVHGTGIGWEFTNPVLDPVLVDGGINKARKVADALGLSSTYSTAQEASQWRQLSTIRAWQKLLNDGKITLPPGWTPSLVYRHIYDNIPSRTRLTGAKGAIFKAAERTRWRQMAKSQLPAGATSEEIDAKVAVFEQQLASQQSLLDLPPKDFVEAATAQPSGGLTNELLGTPGAGLVDEQTARRLYTSMVGSIKDSPKWVLGGGHIDDLIRAGGASFGNGAVANRKVLSRIALAGNNYTRFRNTYRFGIDPTFSARRIVKSYTKLLTVGVPASIHLPYQAMLNQGTLDSDLGLANRLFPEVARLAEGFDVNDRAIYQADLMGLYNPRHFYAYAAGWLKRQGLDDGEIKDRITKALTYGARSGLERTVGTIFYPFSFEKTLYRQLGMRLLDEPGQRMMTAAALDAWQSLNHNDRVGHFIDRHLPVLTELQKLNAFSHGVGPGEIGGINRPAASALWNAFRPQVMDKPTNHYYDVLTSAVPALAELNSLLVGYSPSTREAHGGTLTQQAGITWQEAQNRLADAHHFVFNEKTSPWNPQHPAETYAAQQDDAWALRNHLILQYAAVIDYNYHHRGSEATFPTDGSVPSWLAGKTVTKSSIDEIVHQFYPAYDPTKAQTLAVANKTQVSRIVTQITAANPDRGAAYAQFVKNADKFITYKNQSDLDPATWGNLANWTEQFRAYAAAMAEQDPTFKRFYDRFYGSQLGPLEALTS